MEIEATFCSGLGSEWDVPGTYFLSTSATPEDLQSLVLQILTKDANLGFLLNNVPIITSLEEQLNKQQISTETKITIEFYIQIPPLKSESESQAEDWISSIKIHNSTTYSGDYAGVLMSHSDEKVSKQVFKGPIKSFSLSDTGILVAGLKGEVSLLDYSFDPIALGTTGRLEKVTWNPLGSAFALGGTTGKLQIGTLSDSSLTKSQKRQKTSLNSLSIQELSISHTDKITGLSWPSLDTLISSSWDHSITSTDLEKSSIDSSILCKRAVQCLKTEGNLILSGFEDGSVHGYDSRTQGKILAFVNEDWVRGLSIVGNAVVAGGENGQIKVFDMRGGGKAVSVIDAHEGKVMDIDACVGQIVSGGSDGKVRVFKFIE